jgi:hypothetical protein
MTWKHSLQDLILKKWAHTFDKIDISDIKNDAFFFTL